MPWCETCTKFWTPTSMGPDGTCPSCGNVIAEAKSEPRAPWHFILLLIALAVYLGYRAIQGIIWLTHHV